MNADSHDLIQRHMAGLLTEDEAADLQTRLKTDTDLRRLYLHYMNLDVALEAQAGSRHRVIDLLQAAPQTEYKPAGRWLSWCPLTAAAAGLVIGAFSATAVWAFASAKPSRFMEVPLADGGFEATTPEVTAGVPLRIGQWGGDPTEVVGETGSVQPHSGNRMVRFLATATVEGQRSQFLTADLWQVIALPGEGSRTVRMRAWFNADAPKPARFCLVAVAGASEASTSRKLWATRFAEGSDALAVSKKTVQVDGDPATWELGELVIQVPAGARVLVIDVAADRIAGAEVSDWFPGQFVDDVNVTIAEEVLP